MDSSSTVSNENTINERNTTVIYESSANITKENEQNVNIDSSSVSCIDNVSQKSKHMKPKRGDCSGHQERCLNLFQGLEYIPGEGYYCTICQQYSHSKQGINISEPGQSFRIDKVRKHFGDTKGNMSNIHFNALKKKRGKEHGQQQTIEMLDNKAEEISRTEKSEQVMEKYFRTLYTCAKKIFHLMMVWMLCCVYKTRMD